MDKGKKPLEGPGPNIIRIKRKKIEETSDGQKKENVIDRCNRLRTMKMEAAAAAAAAARKEETQEEDSIDLLLKIPREELEGTSTEYSTEEEKTALSISSEFEVCSKQVTVVSTSEEEEEEEETILSPKGSSTNNPKRLKMNVEQPAGNNQDEQLTLSPEEALKNKQVIEEEDEYEEVMVRVDSSDDTLSDACTRKLPTSPSDKFMDSDDKGKSMRSPPGDDQGL